MTTTGRTDGPGASLLENPFPGLRPFESYETHLYFGRDEQSTAIVQRLANRRFVAVVGTSGSGKSSLVRAGLLPMLEGGFMASAGSFWRMAIMRPGGSAIHNLAAALADPDVVGNGEVNPQLRVSLLEAVLRRSGLGLVDACRQARLAPRENLLVVVDQFEELFRFGGDATADAPGFDDNAAFVNLLLEAVRQTELPIHVVLTMRSDFLGDCARFRDLPEMLNDAQYLIPRLTRDMRRATIEGPIAVSGAMITPRLTQRLLNDAGEDPDVLPIMQHALMRTWDAWHVDGTPDAPIDLVHYERIGGMAEALSLHADQALAELAAIPGASDAASSLFCQLCAIGRDFRETRRPTAFRELCAAVNVDAALMTLVINAFRCNGRTFLMPGWPLPLEPDTIVDVSHESLIRQWRTLRKWLDQEALSAALYRRLMETAQLWPHNAALWRSPDLDRALIWEKEQDPTDEWAARYGGPSAFTRAMEFLRASEATWRDESTRAAAEERAGAERELDARTQRDREARLRAEVLALQSRKRLLSLVAVCIPVLLVGLWWSWRQERNADELRGRAEDARDSLAIAAARATAARDTTAQLLERLTNSNRLKQAFLTGDVAAMQRFVTRPRPAVTSVDILADSASPAPRRDDGRQRAERSALRFESRRTPLGWTTSDRLDVYRFDLYPARERADSLDARVSQISYYMNHPTFNVKLHTAGAGTGFRASYNGWGCLNLVYVLIEYRDANTPPLLTSFDQCASVTE